MTQEQVLRWFALVRRARWWLMVLVLLGAAVAALQAASSDGARYRATAVMFSQGQLPSATGTSQQADDPEPFLRSQAQLATSSLVLGRAAEALGDGSLQWLRDSVSASVDSDAKTLSINASAASALGAIEAANGVAQSLSGLGLEELSTRLRVRADELQRQVDRMAATVDDLNAQLIAARGAGEDTTTLQARRSTASSQYGSLVSSQQELLNQIALQRAPLAMLEPADEAARERNASVPLRAVLGAFVGLLLGLAVLAVRQFLDDTVRWVDQAEAAVRAPLLAELPEERLETPGTIPVLEHPNGGLAESFRGLRTALKFVDHGSRLRSVAVVSSQPGDGKTLTAVNLAVSYAQAGSSVVLVSADLRNPALDALFDVAGHPGLADLLSMSPPAVAASVPPPPSISSAPSVDGSDGGPDGTVAVPVVGDTVVPVADAAGTTDTAAPAAAAAPAAPADGERTELGVDDVMALLQFTAVRHLRVLPSGTMPDNPSELLAGPRATQLMAVLHDHAEIVVVDSPPLLVADPEILGGLVDGIVIVVSINRTRVRRLRRAAGRLSGSNLRLVGLVVNRTNPSAAGYYGGAYGRYYGAYGRQAEDRGSSAASTRRTGVGKGRRRPRDAAAKTASVGAGGASAVKRRGSAGGP